MSKKYDNLATPFQRLIAGLGTVRQGRSTDPKHRDTGRQSLTRYPGKTHE